MNKILSLWAIPRSRSTAFMWMMRNRGDFNILVHPFGKSAYFSEERIFDLKLDSPLKPEYNYQVVLDNVKSTAKEGKFFMKDFPYYFIQIVDDAFLSLFQHTFLIRNPAQMLPSYFQKWPTLTFEETGYQQLYQMFKKVIDFTGEIPPVIDADDLVKDPTSTVKAYCKSVGILVIAEALSWEPPKEKVKKKSWWDGGSWHDKMSFTQGFEEYIERDYLNIDESDRLQSLYELCLPYYEKLYDYRLRLSL